MLESTTRATTIGEFRDVLLRESERVLGAAVTVDGVSTNIDLLVGDTVDIQAGNTFKLDNPPGTLGLVKRDTPLRRPAVHEHIHGDAVDELPNNAQQAPRRAAHGARDGRSDEQRGSAGAGRIHVREVGDQSGKPGLAYFARLLTPFAGNGRGIAFLPEIGDEVVVGFEEGDPERPYVVGAVWNGKDVCPVPTPSASSRRAAIRS